MNKKQENPHYLANSFVKTQKKPEEVFLIAIIPQQRLFGWREVDELGDLERLVIVLEGLPDEELMKKLEQARALQNFGQVLAMDSKAINSLARGKKKIKKKTKDGRRDIDADFGRKTYRGRRDDVTLWEKVVSWFGYKLHLIVDANYELPVDFSVTRASASDLKEGHKLIEHTAERHPKVMVNCEALAVDKVYDDTKLIVKLWDEYRMKSVVDIRNMWRDGDKTRLLTGNVI